MIIEVIQKVLRNYMKNKLLKDLINSRYQSKRKFSKTIGKEEYSKILDDMQNRLSNIEEKIIERGYNYSDNYGLEIIIVLQFQIQLEYTALIKK